LHVSAFAEVFVDAVTCLRGQGTQLTVLRAGCRIIARNPCVGILDRLRPWCPLRAQIGLLGPDSVFSHDLFFSHGPCFSAMTLFFSHDSVLQP
jgi:hypothetical protein